MQDVASGGDRRVGARIASTQVSPLDARFEEEHFELLKAEVDDFRRKAEYDEDDDEAEDAVEGGRFDPLAVD